MSYFGLRDRTNEMIKLLAGMSSANEKPILDDLQEDVNGHLIFNDSTVDRIKGALGVDKFDLTALKNVSRGMVNSVLSQLGTGEDASVSEKLVRPVRQAKDQTTTESLVSTAIWGMRKVGVWLAQFDNITDLPQSTIRSTGKDDASTRGMIKIAPIDPALLDHTVSFFTNITDNEILPTPDYQQSTMDIYGEYSRPDGSELTTITSGDYDFGLFTWPPTSAGWIIIAFVGVVLALFCLIYFFAKTRREETTEIYYDEPMPPMEMHEVP